MSISKLEGLTHPDLPGVMIYPLSGEHLAQGTPQKVLVYVEPGASIPLHTHSVDAEMIVTGGKANVLLNVFCPFGPAVGKEVCPGNHVFFEKEVAHGFHVCGDTPFTFISRNGGIVAKEGWDMTMV